MTELLIEFYGEEIPTTIQKKLETDFKNNFNSKFFAKNIKFDNLTILTGPCRVVVHVTGVSKQIPGYIIEKKGPRTDANTQAIEGFAKTVNSSINALEIREIKGQKNFIYKEVVTERLTKDILPLAINEILMSYSWLKSMYWGNSRLEWIRPLRNILCIFDGQILDFKHGHLIANNQTYGHKFLNDDIIYVNSFDDYLKKLAQSKVIVDQVTRQQLITKQIRSITKQHDLQILDDDKLLDEVTGLVEWPTAMIGTIKPEFLSVPCEILISAMRLHQKYFAVKTKQGEFAPFFIFIANITDIESQKIVVRGNEQVLNARLTDAKFFYEQDIKISLSNMAIDLAKLIFHKKLGTLADKTTRIMLITDYLRPDDDHLQQAARYCKCDLVSGVVREFPDLQGIMGGYYATAEGLSSTVAQAISSHYQPAGPTSTIPVERGAYLALADKIDSLVGLYIAGERATGSGDQYALRRYALGIINIITHNKFNIDLQELIKYVANIITSSRSELISDVLLEKNLISFLEERLKNVIKDKFDINIINALVDLERNSNITNIMRKLNTLSDFFMIPEGNLLIESYKRAYNILAQEEKRFKAGISTVVNDLLLRDQLEITLVHSLRQTQSAVQQAIINNEYLVALQLLTKLHKPISDFFDKVTIVETDLQLSENRLAILKLVTNTFTEFANFTELL